MLQQSSPFVNVTACICCLIIMIRRKATFPVADAETSVHTFRLFFYFLFFIFFLGVEERIRQLPRSTHDQRLPRPSFVVRLPISVRLTVSPSRQSPPNCLPIFGRSHQRRRRQTHRYIPPVPTTSTGPALSFLLQTAWSGLCNPSFSLAFALLTLCGLHLL
ncbi:uncharacterized protein IWZ02DRAFT_123667 [Phyllosticta citriasiana]|uniref:uncharacterized protein n=1 Tax=Phyllosticta citriasiana TaxID=595635 RepID=UPI0030FD656A